MDVHRPAAALLFDMDGLLLDTERLSCRYWVQAAAEAGYRMSEALFVQMIGKPVKENEALVKSVLGEHFPYWDVRARRVELVAQHIQTEGVPAKPGAGDLLTQLELRLPEVPRAVVTSTETKIAEEKLAHSGLLKFFSFVIGPESVSQGKPAPDCYLLAANRLGVVPGDCIVLEDSPAGVRAGASAEMRVIWIPDLAKRDEDTKQLCHAVCEDLQEAGSLIEALQRR